MAKVVTMGEIMLRLSTPNNEKFIQADEFDINYGGGEANVAVSLANYGHEAEFVTAVPDNEIGECAVAALRDVVNQYANTTTYTLNGTATFNLEPFGECSMSIIGSANATALGCTVRLTAPGCSAATGNVGDTGFSGLTFTFISTKATGSESSEARIETFELPTSVGANKDAELEGGTIDQTNHRIAFTCKAGAKLNKLKPTITISPEETATVYPASESEVDFSSGQYIFSVVAEDGTKVNYTVTVTPREEEESTES